MFLLKPRRQDLKYYYRIQLPGRHISQASQSICLFPNLPKKWADKILSYNNGYERKDVSREIKSAGYDIKDSAKQLEDLYCNLTHGL